MLPVVEGQDKGFSYQLKGPNKRFEDFGIYIPYGHDVLGGGI